MILLFSFLGFYYYVHRVQFSLLFFIFFIKKSCFLSFFIIINVRGFLVSHLHKSSCQCFSMRQ